MKYLSFSYVKQNVFPIIYEFYDEEHNPVVTYESSADGIEKLKGCLERIRFKYYKNFFEKASQLCICINKGHLFENGNKRLALVCLLALIFRNNYSFVKNESDEEDVMIKLKELFPKAKLEYHHNFSLGGLALYNLMIIIADSNALDYDPEILKIKVGDFLKSTLKRTRA